MTVPLIHSNGAWVEEKELIADQSSAPQKYVKPQIQGTLGP